MSFWQILGRFALSDTGETLEKVSDTTSVSSDGTTYTKMGSTTDGSDGSAFTEMGSFSTDCRELMGRTATGLGAVFNEQDDWSNTGIGFSRANKRFGMDDDSF